MKKLAAAAAELRLLVMSEIDKKAAEIKKNLIKDQIFLREGKLKDTMTIKKEKRNLARLLTIRREKEYLNKMNLEKNNE